MNLERLSIIDGSAILNDISELPRRAQDLFFTLVADSIFEEENDGVKIIENFYLNGRIPSYSDCKSPIEKIFAFAYDIVLYNQGFPADELLRIDAQVNIETNGHRYFADFVFDTSKMKCTRYGRPLKLIIECDGHDYHEKTKEQIRKDNQREYDLKMAGYDVLHFSGSQIYRDPIKCAQDTFDYIVTKVVEFDIDVHTEEMDKWQSTEMFK